MSERVLPANVEAEKAVLGSVFIKPLSWQQVASELGTDDFQLPAHREIFEAMIAVDRRRMALDVLAVSDELKTRGLLGRLDGGDSYLLAIANAVPTAENVTHYVRIVREKATLRRMIATCAEIQSAAYGDVGEHDEFLRDALGKISKLAIGRTSSESETLVQTYNRMLDDLERAERGELVTRIPTGIAKLDAVLGGGFALEHLVVPVGLTSMGKSSFGFQMAFRGAAERKIPALIFTLEMSRREVLVKGASSLARINSSTFNAPAPPGKVNWKEVMRAGTMAANLSDLIQVEEHRHIGEIVAVSTAWRARHPGAAMILVDHMQKVRGVRLKGASRQEEVWGVASTLKDLAKDLKLPVVSPAQLDNDAAKQERAPKLGDTRESKAIEHEADVVLGIHRDRSLEDAPAELGVLKHRGGRVGKTTVAWAGAWQGFEQPTEDEQRERRYAHDDE